MPISTVAVVIISIVGFLVFMGIRILKKVWARPGIQDMPDHASIDEVKIEESPVKVLDNKELL